jgi:hypothetical protein
MLRPAVSFATLLLVALGVAAASADPAADDRDLDTLLSHFAASRGVEARFREEKSLPLLQEPLVSEGLLYYAPPGRLARFTTRPDRTSLLVLGDRLRIEDGLGVEEIDLAAHAEAKRFIAQLLLLFQGDRKALERDYEVRFEGDGDIWSLVLLPRGLTLRSVIREIALRGREDRLLEMVVTGTQGETTRTTYPRMQVDRPFRPEEISALFPAEGAPVPLASDVASDSDAPDAPAQ